MAIVVLTGNVTAKDVKNAREEYKDYVKITADLAQNLVAIGGEYHADAEKILIESYSSKQKDIWGGGYNIILNKFEANAMINIRPPDNDSPDILDSELRDQFFKLVKEKLGDIQSLLEQPL